MYALFFIARKRRTNTMTTITYVLYQIINEDGHTRNKQQASIHSRQDTPDLVKLYRRTAKKLKSRPRKGTYYIVESGGCLYLEDRKTGQILY